MLKCKWRRSFTGADNEPFQLTVSAPVETPDDALKIDYLKARGAMWVVEHPGGYWLVVSRFQHALAVIFKE